jgi:hypothetical protein
MQNFVTWIIIILLIVLIGVACLFTGIYIGKDILAKDKIEQAKLETIAEITDKVKNLPGIEMLDTYPDNILFGTVTAISGQEITISSQPRTVEQILKTDEMNYTFKVSDKTKLYKLTIKEEFPEGESPTFNDLVGEELLEIKDIQVDNNLSITFNPNHIDKEVIDAIEIKIKN